MYADSKTVWFVKFGSTDQKLLKVKKFSILHRSYGVMAAIVTVKHSVTFKFLNQINKKKTILESAHMQPANSDF